MINLKEALEKNIGKLYGNLQKQSNDEEYKKLKESIKRTYTESTNCKTLNTIFSDLDNFEIYENDICTYPVVSIIKHDIMKSVHPSKSDIGMIHYFENENRIICPVIIIDEILFNLNNKILLDFIIAHELGHYRKNHISSIYFGETNRNILKEIEADLYACDVLGIERCIDGFRELACYAIDNEYDHDVVDEILKRLEFVARKYNVAGALAGFKRELNDCKDNKDDDN